MQYSFTVLALAAAISMASAYDITDIPQCAFGCIVKGATSVGCSATDIACSCKKSDALNLSVQPCVTNACPSLDDQKKVVAVLESLCKDNGVPITLPVPGASSSAAPASSAAPTSSAAPVTSASSVASSASSVASSASSAVSSASSAASSATSSAAASSSGYASASTGAPVAQPTSGVPYNAAGKVGVSMGAAGAMLAAALYAL